MSEFTIAHELNEMVPAPAAKAVVQVLYRSENGILLCFGTAADTVLEAEAANTYAPGCIYIKVVAAGSSVIYRNDGAADAVATFTAMT